MKQRPVRLLLIAFSCSALIVLTGGCAAGQSGMPNTPLPQPSVTAVSAPEPTAAPASDSSATPGSGQAPDTVPAAVPTEDLIAQVQAGLPAKAFDGVRALPLIVAPGAAPLWAVLSTGRHNFDLQPVPSHFVAIYTHGDQGWRELARLDLNTSDGGPDFVDEAFSRQVDLGASRIWLEISGVSGAHSGSFQLVSFDGQKLSLDINTMTPSPGMGTVQDVNGDGKLEVVLDTTDPFVLCYACGARDIHFSVQRWDDAQGKLVEVTLQPLSGQDDPTGQAVKSAVDLAQGGLWKDALAKIEDAKSAAAPADPADKATLDWDYALIKLHTDAMQAAIKDVQQAEPSQQPALVLIQDVFYGDYEAAVGIMGQSQPAVLFSAQSPITSDPMVANFLPDLSKRLTGVAAKAIAARPDLAPAYFVRGWAEYLGDPASADARSDIARAAELAPDNALFTGSVAALKAQ